MISRTLAARRRGATYVVFLTTSMLVVLIGLAAVSVARAETRRAAGEGRTAIARANARSAIDCGAMAIASNADWHADILPNTWTNVALPEGRGQWKVVDEFDGTFEADQTNLVRVYGRGVEGDAVWVESVEVQPLLTASGVAEIRTDLTKNSDFTSGTTNWAAVYGCSIKSLRSGDLSTDGGNYLEVTSRTQVASGARVSLPTTVESGATLEIVFEMFMKNGSDRPEVRVALQGSVSGIDFQFVTLPAVVSERWTVVRATLTPTWEGDLLDASISFGTESTTEDFGIDGVHIRKATPKVFGPIAGTWRREANE